jgi:ribosomal protein S1
MWVTITEVDVARRRVTISMKNANEQKQILNKYFTQLKESTSNGIMTEKLTHLKSKFNQ